MSNYVALQALGLNTSPNALSQPPGAMSTASNIVINRDSIVESRRGFPLYGNSFGTTTDVAKQLFTYKTRILRHYSNQLQFDSTGNGDFLSFAGTYLEPSAGTRIKSIEANENFYFTTNNGIYKIAANNIDELNQDIGYVTPAGGIKGLDLTTTLNLVQGTENGFLQQDAAIAYRVVWGTVDVNNNLILGVPSQRSIIYNPLTSLMLLDYTAVLTALDNIDVSGSLINNGNYVELFLLPSTASATQLYNNLLLLVTAIDNNIVYANTGGSAPLTIPTYSNAAYINNSNLYITFDAGIVTNYLSNPKLPLGTNYIEISGFSAASGSLPTNGAINNIKYETSTVSSIASNIITTSGTHNLASGDPITFTSTNTFPSGITANTIYYVLGTNLSPTTFEIASTIGGSAISLGTTWTGTLTDTTNYLSISVANQSPAPSGIVTVATNAQINSYNYEIITQPTAPSFPATDAQLVALQMYLGEILNQLQIELPTVIPASVQTEFLAPLTLTTSANVTLNITIPSSVTTNDFFQIYRSQQFIATGTTVLNTLVPDDELQQVYEAYPTQAEIDAGFVVVTDIVPDSFLGADLYTNPVSGDGTLQSNEVPPLAIDINRFVGYTFFANTQRRQSFQISLLGVQQMLAEYTMSMITPTVTIASNIESNTYSFVPGIAQNTIITFSADVSNSLNSKYFLIYSANNATEYYVWYNTGGGIDPMIPGATGIEVVIPTNATAIEVTLATYNSFAPYFNYFTVTYKTNTFTPSNINTGTNVITLAVAPSTQPFDLNDPVYFTTTGTLPSGLSATTQYYVISPTSTTIQVSLTPSGSAVVLGTQGTGTHTITSNALSILNNAVGYTNAFNAGTTPFTATTTSGQGERITMQSQIIDVTAGSTFNSSGTANYFLLYDVFNRASYYVWFQRGTSTSPGLAGYTGIEVILTGSETSIQVAMKIVTALSSLTNFTTSSNTNIVTINNVNYGPATAISVANMPATTTTQILDPGALQVLLSTNVSPAVAIDQTARSFIHVVNRNEGEQVWGYYLSDVNSIPGSMQFEAKQLIDPVFYLVANNAATGTSFNPVISPNLIITSITAGDPAILTTSTVHNLENGDSVIIADSSLSNVPNIDGIWPITYISPTIFSIPVNVISATGGATAISTEDANPSNDQLKPNRLYYSKYQEPEAVPLLNYIDIGDEDKPILRIIPLRSSLFIYKEEGLYRLSGLVAPFSVNLFDTSVKLIAPDSVGVTQNTIYSWCSQGIVPVSEAGASPVISRPIDVTLFTVSSESFTHFSTATWGLGYDSDHAYLFGTVQQTTDTLATIIYRFSTLTNTWTTWEKSDTCGIINISDDKLYMGSGTTNYIEQERKNFNRTDYADYELNTSLFTYLNNGLNIILPNTTGMSAGDVLYQLQNLTVFTFNTLLQTLDNDPNISKVDISSISIGSTVTITTISNHTLTTGNYISIIGSNCLPIIDGIYQITVLNSTQFTIIPAYEVIVAGTAMGSIKYLYALNLTASGGDNLRTDLENLATRLDIDPTLTYGAYAILIEQLNNIPITSNSVADPTVIFSPSHGLVNGRFVSINGVTGSIPSINNKYNVTIIDSNHFTIPVDVIMNGTGGTFTAITQDFSDIVACFNAITNELNLDSGTTFKSYFQVTGTTEFEAVILEINPVTNELTLNIPNLFISGPLTVFKAIDCLFTYLPITFGDPVSYKHLSEATVVFTNKAFTDATLSFASDLLPALIPVFFNGDGNGMFGTPGFGNSFFGGGSNSAPFRTYIPRNNQRCRYLTMQFEHIAARETFGIYGMTVTGVNTNSTRAYR